MKQNDLLILGALGIGAFLVFKQLSGASDSAGGGGGGGGNTGDSGQYTGQTFTVIRTGYYGVNPGVTAHNAVNGVSAIVPQGTVIQQLYAPGIKSTSPANTVITEANVRSGQISVIPAYKVFKPSGQGPTILKPQAPLNIKNVFGFPVVPKLIRGL